MTNVETAKAALSFASEALGEDIAASVRAVIISHSHLDHYGGVEAVTAPDGEPREIRLHADFVRRESTDFRQLCTNRKGTSRR